MLRIIFAGAILIAPAAMAQNIPAPAAPPVPGAKGADQSGAAGMHDEVAAAVAADWPRHDEAGKGYLTQDEFIDWLSALRAQGAQASEDPARVKLWAIDAFGQADTDGNQQVSPEEFARYLSNKRKN